MSPTRPLMCPGRCGARRRVGKLMCRSCWNRLPASPRADLFRTWRAAERNLSDDAAWSRYMQARRVAIHQLTRARRA